MGRAPPLLFKEKSSDFIFILRLFKISIGKELICFIVRELSYCLNYPQIVTEKFAAWTYSGHKKDHLWIREMSMEENLLESLLMSSNDHCVHGMPLLLNLGLNIAYEIPVHNFPTLHLELWDSPSLIRLECLLSNYTELRLMLRIGT